MLRTAPAVSEPTLAELVTGLPLSVVFADLEAIDAVRAEGEGSIPLSPPFHVSDEDAYLVLPDDIGLEIVDMFRDGDLDLLEEAMRDGLVVVGTIEKEGRALVLDVEQCARPADLLRELPYAETVGYGRGADPLPALNALDHVQCTVASRFVDEAGLDAILGKREHAGASWRVPKKDKHLAHVDPTYAWSKHLPDGRVGIECALFGEYEELVAVLRPAALAPA
jgi:hypothetical protein